MEKLLSSRSLKKEPDQRWETPAVAGTLLVIAALSLHVWVPPASEYESNAAFGVVALGCALVAVGYCWVRLTSRLGLCPSIYHSTVLKPVVKDRSIRFQVVSGVYLSFFSGLFTLASVTVVGLLCKLEYTENVVPMLLVLMTPLLTCLCAYIICKEGLLFFQALGVLIETAGLVIITLSIGGQWNWTSLVTGGVGLTALTARAMLLKIMNEVRFDPTSATILELLTAGLISTALSLYTYSDNLLSPAALSLCYVGVRLLEGLLWVGAAYMMNIGLYRGPAAMVLGLYCLSVDMFMVWLSPGWNSELLSGVALTGLGAICYLFLDKVLAHTSLGRTLSRPKKQTQRDSFTSAAYIRLIDR